MWIPFTAFLVGAVLTARYASAQSCTPSFAAPVDYALGSGIYPQSIAVGDFNGDGRADLAVADGSSNSAVPNKVSIFLGNGDGTFQTAVNIVLPGAKAIAVGEFNRDGRADLAVVHSGGTFGVYALIGNGDGTFAPAVDYATGNGSTAIVVADFNGDGKADLAVAASGLGAVSVLLGNGDGTFHGALSYGAGPVPVAIASGDFNGDGKTDLVVTNNFSTFTASVSVLIGNGDGTFKTYVSYSTQAASGVVVADFNGDGKADLAVGSGGILFGNGDGTFQAPVNRLGVAMQIVFEGDFDSDGKPDLAGESNGITAILLGNGDGTFRSAPAQGLGVLAAGDFNGDGKPDLAARSANSDDVGRISVLLNTFALPCANTSFADAVSYAAGVNPLSLATADFNGDGRTDVVVANKASSNLSMLKGNGNGTLQPAVNFGALAGPTSVAVGDFNLDGKPDLAVSAEGLNAVSILLGNGNATFNTPVNQPVGSQPSAVAVDDFNRDGRPDLAVANRGSANVSILLGNGNGTFNAAVTYGAGTNPSSVTSGDFNRDGKPDLAVANQGSNTVSILLGNGDGSFQAAVSYATGAQPSALAVGDFNRDGKPDIAVADTASNEVSILLGNGDGTFQAGVPYAAGTGPTSVVAIDLNGDGRVDLAVADGGADTVSLLRGNGDGTFQPAVDVVSTSPSAILAADLDRDGKLDLAVANRASSSVTILLNTNCKARHLRLETDVSVCNTTSSPLGTQPVLALVDDGSNVSCDARSVVASIVPGTGTAGASLGGTRSVAPVAGIAAYTDLSVDLPGIGYRLQFSHAVGTASSGLFTLLPALAIMGPTVVGAGNSVTYDAGPGYDSYDWVLDGTPIATTRTLTLTGLALGSHTLQVSVSGSGCGPLQSAITINVVPPGSVCDVELVLVPDGRIGANNIAAGSPAWYRASVRLGNSYSLEFKNATGATVPPGTLTVFSGDDGCSGTSTLVSRDTTAIDPGAAAAVRVSFTASGTSPLSRAILANGASTSILYTFSLSDTTMFSPAWSTNGVFDTYYSFQNTTMASLSATLMLLDAAGAVVTTFPVSIPAGGRVSTNTAALAVGRNQIGSARLTHDGPPGAVLAQAAMASFMISPPYVQPVKFQVVREAK